MPEIPSPPHHNHHYPLPLSPPPPFPSPAPTRAPSSNCNPSVTNVEYEGKWYFVQWKNRAATKYTWDQAKSSCSRLGMRIISMDNPGKREFFLNMLERDRYEYFWAGATIRR